MQGVFYLGLELGDLPPARTSRVFQALAAQPACLAIGGLGGKQPVSLTCRRGVLGTGTAQCLARRADRRWRRLRRCETLRPWQAGRVHDRPGSPARMQSCLARAARRVPPAAAGCGVPGVCSGAWFERNVGAESTTFQAMPVMTRLASNGGFFTASTFTVRGARRSCAHPSRLMGWTPPFFCATLAHWFSLVWGSGLQTKGVRDECYCRCRRSCKVCGLLAVEGESKYDQLEQQITAFHTAMGSSS